MLALLYTCAGGENRTLVLCLEGRYSTTKLHPQYQDLTQTILANYKPLRNKEGGVCDIFVNKQQTITSGWNSPDLLQVVHRLLWVQLLPEYFRSELLP